MLIISSTLNLLGLLLNFIGFIGVYKHRDNIFGKISTSDIDNLKQKLSTADAQVAETTTKTILKKVTRAHDYFICIIVGFLLEFIAVAITFYGIIYQPK